MPATLVFNYPTLAECYKVAAFNGLGRVSPTPAGTITYDVGNPSGGTCRAAGGTMRCLRVEVSPTGQVRMCDPSLTSATDPQGC